jgi:hypothetical protein
MPVSCFDCPCKILSDPVLDVPEAVDWGRFLFLERYKGRDRTVFIAGSACSKPFYTWGSPVFLVFMSFPVFLGVTRIK